MVSSGKTEGTKKRIESPTYTAIRVLRATKKLFCDPFDITICIYIYIYVVSPLSEKKPTPNLFPSHLIFTYPKYS